MLGVHLVSYATRRREGMDAREAEDVVNDFGRDPIGEGKEEQVRQRRIILTSLQKLAGQIYNRELKVILDRQQDDAAPVAEIGERERNREGGNASEGTRRRPKLEELTRFTMVKRIW